MNRYDVDKEWVDPCESVKDRRGAVRFSAHLRLDVAVPAALRRGAMVGPGKLKDISLTGASFVTKHDVTRDQRLQLRIPTERCESEVALPRAFVGSARVVRVSSKGGRSRQVSVQFSPTLTESIEFAVFVNHLHRESHIKPALSA